MRKLLVILPIIVLVVFAYLFRCELAIYMAKIATHSQIDNVGYRLANYCSGACSDEIKSQASVVGAKIALKHGSPQTALLRAKTAIRRDEKNADAYLMAAMANLIKKGKLDESIQYIDEAIALSPDDRANYEMKAHILMEHKQHVEALPIYEKILQDYPGSNESNKEVQEKIALIQSKSS